MSKKFNLIINVSIIILIIALVTVMMSYYTGALEVPTNNDSEINVDLNNSGDNDITNINNDNKQTDYKIIIINSRNSGEIQKSNEENNDVGESDDIKNEEIESGDSEMNNTHELSTSPVIITSENEISSKEKREILTELDKTLMELLEIVDKVQTVDETRLITDDSEVQE